LKPLSDTTIALIVALIALFVVITIYILNPLSPSPFNTYNEPLQDVDAVLYLTVETQKINETYSVDWMNVTLKITLKNTGNKVITIKDIRIDPQQYPLKGFMPFNITPGSTYTGSFPVILNKETGETRIPYDPLWEKGTVHVVFVFYRVQGEKIDREMSWVTIVR